MDWKPEDVSKDAWDAARWMLSEAYTESIKGREQEVIELARKYDSDWAKEKLDTNPRHQLRVLGLRIGDLRE